MSPDNNRPQNIVSMPKIDTSKGEAVKPDKGSTNGGKTRYDDIMNYLGNIEEEFSQFAITNRSAIQESPSVTPSRARLGAAAANPSAIDDSSFLGS